MVLLGELSCLPIVFLLFPYFPQYEFDGVPMGEPIDP